MSSATANNPDIILDAGVFYFCGGGASRRTMALRLPMEAFRYGWHPVESWGRWAAKREAQVRFRTPYASGAGVLVAVLLNAPPGSEANYVMRIGDVDGPSKRLGETPSWFVAEGVASHEGLVRVTLLAAGRFGRPDPRELYAGIRSLAYVAADDRQARDDLLRRATVSPLEMAGRAIFRAVSPLAVARRAAARRRAHRSEAVDLTGPTQTDFDKQMAEMESTGAIERLAPELAPRPLRDLLHHHHQSVEVRQLGRSERTRWGTLRTLRGVESIRGFCISSTPIIELQILLNGYAIETGPVKGGYTLKYEINKEAVQKYVFNVWYDFSSAPAGPCELELRFLDADHHTRSHREQIVIAAPLAEGDHPTSDRIVGVPDGGSGSLEQQVNARPSMIRVAKRTLFESPPRNVLIVRADQLGDLVCSAPAMRRLRELLPAARLVALLSAANEGLARSLGLFDEIIVIDFRDDPTERRRVMPIEDQRELKSRLEPYKFDLAIDLSDSGVSRPLLFLSGAPSLYGFRPGEFPWLSLAFEGITRDFANNLERTPHTNKLMGLVEWLGVNLKSHSEIIRRLDLKREILAPYGLASDRYAVLHTGARIRFSRWPYYQELASLILRNTDLKVVMMADDPEERSKLDPGLLDSDRFQLIDKRLDFDDFDALLSFCDLFVGNDSGPKHLASLRGANVISIHMARNNWNEWGQENKGFIVSRRVPCAGCSIHHDAEECGKEFACITNISTREVFDAAMKLVKEERAPSISVEADEI